MGEASPYTHFWLYQSFPHLPGVFFWTLSVHDKNRHLAAWLSRHTSSPCTDFAVSSWTGGWLVGSRFAFLRLFYCIAGILSASILIAIIILIQLSLRQRDGHY